MFLHVKSKIRYLVMFKIDKLVVFIVDVCVYIYIECVCIFKSSVWTPAL